MRRLVSPFFNTMAETSFAIGIPGNPPPRVKKVAKATTIFHDAQRDPIYRFTPYPWLLTPPKNPISLLAIHQAVDPDTKKEYTSIVPILEFLKNEFRQQKMLYPNRTRFPCSLNETLASISRAMQHVKKNQQHIMAFRSLAHKWLLKRRFKAGNDEDLMTGEIPKKLVTLTVWSERRTYTFEGATIRRDMMERLFQHSYLFPKYLMPRNPYTNCEMTPCQFASIITQLRAFGLSHWAFEGLLKCKYDMEKFKAMFAEPLKRELIAKHFNNMSPETIDIVIDFMDDQHDANDKYFDHALYRWTFEHWKRHSKITRWVSLCKRYHESVVNIHDRLDLGKELLNIQAECLLLCSYPGDLADLRNEERKKQGLPPILLVPPTPEPAENSVLQFTTPAVEINNLILHFTHLYSSEITITGGDETPTETEAS